VRSRTVGLPVDFRGLACEDWTADLLMAHMMKDKKVQDGKITFVLVHGIGQAYLERAVEATAMQAYLSDILQRSQAARLV